jgi:hypothetical protein
MRHCFNILVNYQSEACLVTNDHYNPIAPPIFSRRLLILLGIIFILPITSERVFLIYIAKHIVVQIDQIWPGFYFSAEISEISSKTGFTGYHRYLLIPNKIFRFSQIMFKF